MTTLKFKAWDEDSQKMNGNIEIYIAKDKTIEVRPKDDKTILMQSTGLVDKNGKEIYEGDIIKCSDGHDYYFGVVAYDKDYGNFGVIEDNDEDVSSFGFLFEWENVEELEVIGNIYENKELLGGK